MKRFLTCIFLLLPLSALAQPVLYATQACGNCEPLTQTGLYTIDPATGTPTLVGDTGESITGLDFDPITGVLYGTTTPNSRNPSSLITINPATAAITVIGPHGVDEAMTDLSFAPDGTLYGWAESSQDSVATINIATGAATLIADAQVSSGGCALDMAADGFLYLFGEVCRHDDYAESQNDNSILKLNPATGLVVDFINIDVADGECQGWTAGSHNATGTLYGFTGARCGSMERELATLNLSTGAVNIVGTSLDWASGIAFTESPAAIQQEPVPTLQRTSLIIAVIVFALLGSLIVYRRKHA